MTYSKCRVCRGPAIIDLPRHNANFCADHLMQLCRRQVEKAIVDHDMLSGDDRILVAETQASAASDRPGRGTWNYVVTVTDSLGAESLDSEGLLLRVR